MKFWAHFQIAALSFCAVSALLYSWDGDVSMTLWMSVLTVVNILIIRSDTLSGRVP